MCDKPALFRFFRPDEISCLNFDANPEVTDDTLLFVNHLTGIRRLDLYQTEVSDRGLLYLVDLPNLSVLNVSKTMAVTGRGLAKLKRIGYLTELQAESVKEIGALIPSLRGSSSLQVLCLARDNLTKHDVEAIATCRNLQVLDIAHNPLVGDSAVAHLGRLTKLQQLSLKGCSATPLSIRVLKQLPLKTLSLSKDKWTPSSMNELHNALPKCSIVFY
jgi:Leucine-rich repeat (LRR) protein